MPEQDADLPSRLEASIERAGQMLKRRLFQQAVEQADAELVLSQRHGKDGRLREAAGVALSRIDPALAPTAPAKGRGK